VLDRNAGSGGRGQRRCLWDVRCGDFWEVQPAPGIGRKEVSGAKNDARPPFESHGSTVDGSPFAHAKPRRSARFQRTPFPTFRQIDNDFTISLLKLLPLYLYLFAVPNSIKAELPFTQPQRIPVAFRRRSFARRLIAVTRVAEGASPSNPRQPCCPAPLRQDETSSATLGSSTINERLSTFTSRFVAADSTLR
jgi:hypothetical protein